MEEPWRILVVDDEPSVRESLSAWLAEDGYAVDTAPAGAEAVEMLRATDYAVCFVDLKMPGGMDGLEVLREIRQLRPETAVLIITAFATVDTAVEAMKMGAHDYVTKPFNLEEISLLTKRIIEVKEIQRENRYLRRRLARRYEFGDIISKSDRMQPVLELIRKVAPSVRDMVGKMLAHGHVYKRGENFSRAVVLGLLLVATQARPSAPRPRP